MSRQRRAENSSSSSSESDRSDSSQLHLQADESADEEILQAYLGTVAVPVEELNTSWVHSTHGNRPLDAHHVQHLQRVFAETGIHKTPIENRMLAGISLSHWKEMVRALLDEGEHLKEALRRAAAGDWRIRGRFSEFRQLETLGGGRSPVLYAGQHRRAAVLALREQIASPDESLTAWPVDFFNEAKLSALGRARLQENRKPTILVDTDGDLWAKLTTLLDDESAAKRKTIFKSKSAFEQWGRRVSKLSASEAQRWYTLFRHPLKNVIDRFCQTAWGRKTMTVGAFDSAIKSRMHDRFRGILTAQLDALQSALDQKFPSIQASEVNALARLSQPFTRTELTNLFFPPGTAGKNQTRRVALQEAVFIRGKEHSSRRAGFFTYLDDMEYFTVYQYFVHNPDVSIISYAQFASLTHKVGVTAGYILHHVVTWINPRYEKPGNASKDRRNETWKEAIHRSLDAYSRQHPNWTRSDNDSRADDLENQIYMLIYRSSKHWNDSAVKPTYTTTPDQVQALLDQGKMSAADYRKRFDLGIWNELRSRVQHHLGTDPFHWEVMAFFNYHAEEEETPYETLPWTTWGRKIQESMWASNWELQGLPFLRTEQLQADLVLQGALFGAKWTYRALRQRLLAEPSEPVVLSRQKQREQMTEVRPPHLTLHLSH
ncbi:hypothetical protein L228DRAFT_56339 [Xylona heveae TC161]|uniref:Uncharacterized protein n=1 Tax=Xylona heveae (strain CBS 132557 / TC161) TaxID=1328760 RepID=A0A164Z7P0_XYLHT|nr:hypothetical protein L228DRAFT_56339 [Xylona heveae TC161]KZF18789.1 hypothetical protein L228DRAFT_56339 [Xylona heveae TC161]